MLGWEFPPYISGGLGTACFGLTRGLNRQGVDIVFVLPRGEAGQDAAHVELVYPDRFPSSGATGSPDANAVPSGQSQDQPSTTAFQVPGLEHVSFHAVPSGITNPYAATPAEADLALRRAPHERAAPGSTRTPSPRSGQPAAPAPGSPAPGTTDKPADDLLLNRLSKWPETSGPTGYYHGDVVAESKRYADRCLDIVSDDSFDVIHAHDWMTFPAGLSLAARSGKPLVAHVHSTEFDRAGEHQNTRIVDIERSGLAGAQGIICVSELTRQICVHQYDVPKQNIDVIYNGIDPAVKGQLPAKISGEDKIVLFLGRITHQKGPGYFVQAARKVLGKYPKVKFVMAGSGDQTQHVRQMAEELGIADRVVFTGFLRGADVDRVFQMADVYVMPSVSEPFGIAPLEAIRHDVPVIISRNSGVAEVLRHALKVDVTDVNDIADKILAVLRHKPLSKTLREHADLEIRALSWDEAATKAVQTYRRVTEGREPTDPAQA
jgi:glycosyltransferase involved in cell wall biosynthesis